MPSYKLYYFNARGRGEAIRLALVVAGQKFEDVRIEFPDWPSKKKDFKFGQLPVLEVDGEHLNQSVAILHYIGTQHGLAGKTPLDAAKCHAIVETMNDLIMPHASRVLGEKDNNKRAELIKKEIEPEFKKILTLLESLAKETHDKTKTTFWVAGQLTYADLLFHNMIFTLGEWLGADYIKQFPTLHKFYENVGNQPKLKEYLAKRSKTPF